MKKFINLQGVGMGVFKFLKEEKLDNSLRVHHYRIDKYPTIDGDLSLDGYMSVVIGYQTYDWNGKFMIQFNGDHYGCDGGAGSIELFNEWKPLTDEFFIGDHVKDVIRDVAKREEWFQDWEPEELPEFFK